jgi:hypothetical protein
MLVIEAKFAGFADVTVAGAKFEMFEFFGSS